MEKSLKIVMVDDNTDFLFTMETFLQRNGFEVHTAEEGQQGMDLIRQERPDLVMLDIMMETLFSGFEVCKQIRSDNDLKDTPIIGISGMGEELEIEIMRDKRKQTIEIEIPDNRQSFAPAVAPHIQAVPGRAVIVETDRT